MCVVAAMGCEVAAVAPGKAEFQWVSVLLLADLTALARQPSPGKSLCHHSPSIFSIGSGIYLAKKSRMTNDSSHSILLANVSRSNV
jgi:hypothetical protein